MWSIKLRYRKRWSSFEIIILGFAGVILAGALLLMLPVASREGNVTPFTETLFTATSAACVTGLAVRDTGSYWSVFGQSVILLLIQIGGLGVVTIAVSIAMLSGRKISLMQRSTMQDAISAPKVGGIVRLTRFILKGTFGIELLGALFLLPVFLRDYGGKGIWMALFHSVSAFCNAGFDLLGKTDHLYPSLTSYVGNPLVNLTIMGLIVTGGIGFLTWDDFCTNKWNLKRYRLQSKIILVTTAVLILLPAIFFFLSDFAGFSMGKRILASFFQSVTLRTAGFNTADLGAMNDSSKAIMILMMLIGGSPGSTAGGMKTTTIAVLILNAFATFGREPETEVFGRRFDNTVVKNAATIAILYFFLFFTGGIAISQIEHVALSDCLFETASAVGTAGLTLGITTELGLVSHLILVVLMYLGRVGGLTLIYAAISVKIQSGAKRPLDKITVG